MMKDILIHMWLLGLNWQKNGLESTSVEVKRSCMENIYFAENKYFSYSSFLLFLYKLVFLKVALFLNYGYCFI